MKDSSRRHEDRKSRPAPGETKGEAVLEKSNIKVLLIEDDPGGSVFWEQILAEFKDIKITFFHIEQLSNFSNLVENDAPDIILLDLSLPEGGGFELFLSVFKMAPAIPIIVITESDDQKLAVQTALEGAQDCLVKRDIGSFLLSRSIRYAPRAEAFVEFGFAIRWPNINPSSGLHACETLIAGGDD